MFETRELTADGFERHWGLNHLAYVQLTVELLSMLKSSIPARIVNVASRLHAGGAINFADLQQATRFDMRKAYSQSKLANVMFTYALARRLAGTGVTVNCLHPGVVRTGLTDGIKSMKRLLVPLIKPFMLTPAQGAVTSIFAATSPDVERISGRYFVMSRPAQSSKPSYDDAAQERLWEISLEQCQLNDPTIN
jgi:retinol dehydrogenase 12